MRILICMRYADYNAGGAEKSMLTLAKMLKKEGHKVRIISLGYKDRKINYRGIPLTEIKFRPYIVNKINSLKEIEKFIKVNNLHLGIEEEINSFSPNIIFTQHEISFLIANMKIKNKLRAPFYLFIHGFEYLRQRKNIHSWETDPLEKNARKFLGEVTEEMLVELIKSSKGIFFPSSYLMNLYLSLGDKEKFHVINPFVEINELFKNKNTKNKRDFILHVNPSKNKGIEITLSLAEKLKDEKFLIVGNKPERKILEKINSLDNVYYREYKENMSEIYKISRILIIPSIQPETYSLTSIEAQSAGCDIIASKNGGINAPDKAFVRDVKSINEWLNTIKKGGARFSMKQLQKFDARNQLKKLKKITGIKNERI